MNDALLVRPFERVRNLDRDRDRFVEWQRSPSKTLREVLPFDQFHHERATLHGALGASRAALADLGFLDAVDVRDIGMPLAAWPPAGWASRAKLVNDWLIGARCPWQK